MGRRLPSSPPEVIIIISASMSGTAKVSDLQRSIDFYCGLLGFELMIRYGAEAAFVSAGGYHHHIGLNVWYSKGQRSAAVNRFLLRAAGLRADDSLWGGGCLRLRRRLSSSYRPQCLVQQRSAICSGQSISIAGCWASS